jgi:acyl-coenzyme A synthetase/AMP-(fatty) acid ligase
MLNSKDRSNQGFANSFPHRGYINNTEATAATFSEGWLRTGDIMRMDEDQNFWVTDRLKEVRYTLSIPSMIRWMDE